ncbi:MAG: GntR family transcriptional regulator [Treponema sp.]|jgi:DNA-binding FadR family transcriptional regulator|nr:GntR family transcriptional regulator [Treponema sp.]
MVKHHLFSVEEKRPTTVDVVVNKIKELLIEQKIAPSEMIPSEQALAEGLKVSRGSVREAMKILSAFGIVEIKRGDGTYISTASNTRLFDPLLFQILVQDRDYQSLIEIRQILEEGIVRLMVKKATDEEFEMLSTVIKEFEKVLSLRKSTIQECNAVDLKYHQLMGQFSHNTILESIYYFIIDLFSPTINSKQPGAFEVHWELHNALFARDEDRAVEAIKKHTQVWVDFNIHKENGAAS